MPPRTPSVRCSIFLLVTSKLEGHDCVVRKAIIVVELDLDRYGEQWEDFYDALVVGERAYEKRESWETVKKRLVRAGKLRCYNPPACTVR
jgi:hypothetical protein